MPSPAASPPPEPAATGELPLEDPGQAWWAGAEPLSGPGDRQDTDPELAGGFGAGSAPAAGAFEQPATPEPPPTEPSPTEPASVHAGSREDLAPWGGAEAAVPVPRAALPPSVRAGRRVREGAPTPISPARALAGGAVAVAGVALGIVAILYLPNGSNDAKPAAAQAAGSVTTPAAPASKASAPATASAPTPAPAVAPTTVPVTPLPSASTIAPPVAPPAPPVTRPPLTVLNNSRVNGLADRMAATFAKDGWSVGTVGNFTGRISSTTVYYAPGQEAAAQELAKAYAIPRVLPRFAGLPGSGLTVVLTRDAA